MLVRPLFYQKSHSSWRKSDRLLAIVRALGEIGDNRATDTLLARLQDTQENEELRQAAATALGQIKDARATEALLARLQDAQENQELRQVVAIALGRIGEARGIKVLSAYLQDTDEFLRCIALGGLASTCIDETDRELLSEDLDGFGPWLDPLSPITAERIALAADKLEKPREEIQQRYAALAERFGLKLAL